MSRASAASLAHELDAALSGSKGRGQRGRGPRGGGGGGGGRGKHCRNR